MTTRNKLVYAALMLALLVLPAAGCDVSDVFSWFPGYSGNGSMVGGGFYDDGSWGNWLTGNYVSTDSNGNAAIWGDGFYCVDGECSVSKSKHH